VDKQKEMKCSQEVSIPCILKRGINVLVKISNIFVLESSKILLISRETLVKQMCLLGNRYGFLILLCYSDFKGYGYFISGSIVAML
jgi:hypothetical protein